MGDVPDPGQKISMDRLDQVLWKLQRHAFHHAVCGAVAYLEGNVNAEQLNEWHQGLVKDFPRLTWLVGGSERNPAWEPDPHFAIEHHLSRIPHPHDEDPRHLLRLVHDLTNEPFPPDTPPWHAYLIEDADGQTLYFLKISHAIADGLRLVDLMRRRQSSVTSTDSASKVRELPPKAHRPKRLLLWYRLLSNLHTSHRQLRSTGNGSDREIFFFTLPLEQIKQAAKVAGQVTANDVMLCAVAHGMARYRKEYEEGTPRRLRVMVLVGRFRVPTPHTGNAINFASIRLPTRHTDMKAALQETRQAVVAAGGAQPADVAGLAAALAPHVPGAFIAMGLNYAARRHDYMATNVPAGKDSLTIADKRATAVFGMPPLMGTGMVTAMVSYQGTCHFTVHVDPAVISNPQGLNQCIRAAFDDVMKISR